MSEDESKFVTYKWLFATAVSLLIITLGFSYFFFGSITQALQGKADVKWVEERANLNATRITILNTQLDKMESKQDEILRELYAIKSLIRNGKQVGGK